MCRGTGVLLEFPAREGIWRLEYTRRQELDATFRHYVTHPT
jgi:hypothetical protein